MTHAIYTAYHKTFALIQSPSIRPIHVGRANAKTPLPDMIGDDTGDNISANNGSYCELTALYWAWKNDTTSDHIGLMHYRRLFDFAGEYTSADAEVFLGEMHIADYTQSAEDWLASHPDVDLVLPRPHKMHISVRANYEAEHDPRDIAAIEAILKRDAPEYLPFFNEVFDGSELWLANMFVARRDIVNAYCPWVFDVLAKLDAAHERPWLSPYNARYLGFMSERLFQVWLKKYLADHPKTKVHRANIINLSKALTFPVFSGAALRGPEHVNVAFSSDTAYLPHTAAMMRSLIEYASPERQYNLFYLHEDIPPKDLELCQSMLFGRPNVTLYPINVRSPFQSSYRSAFHAPTNATFNRFLLFDLLPDLDRLLYLDGDMILRGDIAEIFDVDMEGYELAAVPDFIMTRVLTTRVVTDDPNVPDLRAYLNDTLGMTDTQISSYFNAGLMVLNFKEMDVQATGRALLERVNATKYFFRDQDILNEHFKGKYLRLPARYNVFNSEEAEYAHVPEANRREALAAKHAPFLIHFAAWQHKPWTYAETQFSDLYWRALEGTPFHKRVLKTYLEGAGGLNARSGRRATPAGIIVNAGAGLANAVPVLRPMLLRIYHGLKSVRQKLRR